MGPNIDLASRGVRTNGQRRRRPHAGAGDVSGNVDCIAILSTNILNGGNLIIQNPVINWSHNESYLRVSVLVGVSCSSDPEAVHCGAAAGGHGLPPTPLTGRLWTSLFRGSAAVRMTSCFAYGSERLSGPRTACRSSSTSGSSMRSPGATSKCPFFTSTST